MRWLGQLYEKEKDSASAERYYKKAISLNDEISKGYYATILFHKGKKYYSEAERLWIDAANLGHKQSIKNLINYYKSVKHDSSKAAPAHMPEWVIYALPDGLWACSYAIFIGVIWNFEYPKCIPVALFIPLIGVVSEFLQAFRLLPGIFDWWDLIMYIMGGIVGYAYIYWINWINSYNCKSLKM